MERTLSNEELKEIHMRNREQFLGLSSSQGVMFFGGSSQSSGVKPVKRGSTSMLSEKRSLKIRDLGLCRTHEGCFLQGKIILPGFSVVGCNLLIEDEEKNLIRVSVYNALKPHASMSTVKKQFPVGKSIAILDPFCKLGTNDMIRMIRVDDPSKVILLDGN